MVTTDALEGITNGTISYHYDVFVVFVQGMPLEAGVDSAAGNIARELKSARLVQ